jgi:hydrogenase expression/formation protein HypE
VRGACEILGYDPLYLPNEGRFVAFVASPDAERALSIMDSHPFGGDASIIGEVANASSAIVTLKSRIGATRIVDMLAGEQLPRIC